MKEALSGLKSEFLKYKDTRLKRIGTQIKKGVFSTTEIFPAIALLPNYEELERPWSGGVYKVNRGINIEVWSHRFKTQDSFKITMEIIEELKEILQTSQNLRGQVFDIVYGSESFGSEPPQEATFLQSSTLPIILRTTEELPSQRENPKTLRECSAKELTEVIFSTLKDYKKSTLGKIESFKCYTEPPMPGAKELVLVSNTENLDHTWPGREGVVREFELLYWTHLFGKEASLEINLSTIEALKDICQKHYRWDGYCLWSWIPRIDYGQYATGRTFLYATSLKLECMSKENL